MATRRGLAGELRHGILSVADALAQSIALLSLALGVAFASSAAAGETGIAAQFAYLIAGVGSLCLGSVIIRFTRRMASAGGLYTYIARGINPSAGFLGGWLYGSRVRGRHLVRARDRRLLHVDGDDGAHR